jgi:hypothetical protein
MYDVGWPRSRERIHKMKVTHEIFYGIEKSPIKVEKQIKR